MSNFSNKPPKSGRSASKKPNRVGQFLQREQGKWIENAKREREEEIQRTANAEFPWLSLLYLFMFYAVTGFLLSFLTGLWAFVGWITIIFMSLILLGQAFNEPWFFESFLIDIVFELMDLPFRSIADKLSDAFKRQIFSQTKNEWWVELKLQTLSISSFFVIFFVGGLGLWLGYFTKIRLF